MQGIDAIDTLEPLNIEITGQLWGIDEIYVIFEALFRKFQSRLALKLWP